MTRDNRTPAPSAPVFSPIPTGLKPSGRLPRPALCLLLDVYGTLFISASGDIHSFDLESDRFGPLAVLLKKYRLPDPPERLVQRLLAAIAAEHEKRRAEGVDFPEVRIEQIWQDLLPNLDAQRVKAFAAEFERCINPVSPMPHLRETLDALKESRILMGIISNAQFYTPDLFETVAGASLKELGFSDELLFFSFVSGRAKPSTWMFEKAKSRLEEKQVPPERVLYVGNDMRNDIFPAAAVGFKTALFAGDARSLRLRTESVRCKTNPPDLVITDLVQLPDAAAGRPLHG